MKLEYAFLADFALAHPDGRIYVIGGGFDRIYIDRVPFRHPHIALVVKLRFERRECGVEHQLQVTGSGPDGSKLLTNALISVRPELDLVASDLGVNSHSVLNIQGIEITAYGEHLLHLVGDGGRLGTVSLQVLKAASEAPFPRTRPLH